MNRMQRETLLCSIMMEDLFRPAVINQPVKFFKICCVCPWILLRRKVIGKRSASLEQNILNIYIRTHTHTDNRRHTRKLPLPYYGKVAVQATDLTSQ